MRASAADRANVPSACVPDSGHQAASVADLLAAAIERSGKLQREIAAQLGYTRPNIITMFKQGATRVPLDIAPALARAVGLDPAGFLRACLAEYDPPLLDALETTLGDALSENERLLIRDWRCATANTDPLPASHTCDGKRLLASLGRSV